MPSNHVQQILDNQLITICRGLYGESLLSLAQSLYEGGIRLIEVTFDQSDKECISKTGQAISMLSNHFGDRMLIGAGTVLTKEQVDKAKKSGASYIISPNVDVEIIKYTKQLELVSIPGAMTPSEIIQANSIGADIVKVFPAGYLGLNYVKDIRGPINHVPLLAAGGINEDNIRDYADAGYAGFGISGRLTDKKVITLGEFSTITARAKEFIKQLNR